MSTVTGLKAFRVTPVLSMAAAAALASAAAVLDAVHASPAVSRGPKRRNVPTPEVVKARAAQSAEIREHNKTVEAKNAHKLEKKRQRKEAKKQRR